MSQLPTSETCSSHQMTRSLMKSATCGTSTSLRTCTTLSGALPTATTEPRAKSGTSVTPAVRSITMSTASMGSGSPTLLRGTHGWPTSTANLKHRLLVFLNCPSARTHIRIRNGAVHGITSLQLSGLLNDTVQSPDTWSDANIS